MCRHRVVLSLLLLLPIAGLRAQTPAWNTVNQQAMWVSAFIEQPVTNRVAVWSDLHWRRMGLGEEPQAFLGRVALLFTHRPNLRSGVGYAYVASAPYGESPAPSPSREHRAWQQLQLNQSAGTWALSYRLRTEQRWIAPLLNGSTGDYGYHQRVRVQLRGQHPLGGVQYHGRPVQGFAFNEILVPIGHDDGAQRRLQNRASVGVGIPLNAQTRVDVGYLNLWNRIPQRTTQEFNHTLQISFVYTGQHAR